MTNTLRFARGLVYQRARGVLLSCKLIQGFEASVNRIARIFNAIGMAMLLVLLVLGVGDIIGRYVFSRPITGAKELSEVLLAMMVSFALAYTLALEAHVKADIVTSRFSTRLRVMIKLAISSLLLSLFSLMIWQGVKIGILYWDMSRLVDILYIPLAPFQFLVCLGVLFLCLVLISQICQLGLKLPDRG